MVTGEGQKLKAKASPLARERGACEWCVCVRTQRPDGGWSDPVTVPCEPHLVVTAAPTIRRSGRVAARVGENHLPKLRGYRNSEVRMEIAAFLGVREAPDLARLRAVRDVLAALPTEEEEEEGDY